MKIFVSSGYDDSNICKHVSGQRNIPAVLMKKPCGGEKTMVDVAKPRHATEDKVAMR